jgi:RNA polymerase sigma-B factor
LATPEELPIETDPPAEGADAVPASVARVQARLAARTAESGDDGVDDERQRKRAEERELFIRYRANPDDALRDELVERFGWVANHCARRFTDRGEPYDDLIQVARIGVFKAITRFDPEVADSFISFAIPTVLGELRRHFRDTTWAIKVPRRIKDRHVEIGATIDFLNRETGRPPTPDQVAEHLGIGVEEVLEVLDAGAAHRMTSLASNGERGDDDEFTGLVLGDLDPDLGRADDQMLLSAAVARLPERERRIIELRFIDELSQSEIAEKVGVSQVHVSRLLRRSLELLRARLGDDAATTDS